MSSVELQDYAEELDGSLAPGDDENKLMRSVLEGDNEDVEDGRVISDGMNRNIGAFTPDLMYSQVVRNYQVAKQIYGERILRVLTGCSLPNLERNLRIPEFHHELLRRIKTNVKRLEDKKLVTSEGRVTEEGMTFATLVMIQEELDKLQRASLTGSTRTKERSHTGEKNDTTRFVAGSRFHDIDIYKTIRMAVRRGRTSLSAHDLYMSERVLKSNATIIFALDASASMKGKKLEMAKKAGIALAYTAYLRKDKIGLVVFGSDIKDTLAPTDDFHTLVQSISRIRATRETEFVSMFHQAVDLFGSTTTKKHLIVLSDALPTKGNKPEAETRQAISLVRSHDITVSVVGIQLDKAGRKLATEIAHIGEGRLIDVKNPELTDIAVLEEYDSALASPL